MANKPKAAPRKKTRRTDRLNILLIGTDGAMYLKSGSTGKIRELTPAETKKVAPLLKERQQLGIKLTKLLQTKDFALSGLAIVDTGP